MFANREELSRAAAARFAELCQNRVEGGNIFTTALSGGSTPRRFYEILSRSELSEGVLWDRVHLFQVDERCVPPDHPESNYRMIREALLDRVPIPKANVHRIQAELPDPEDAAQLCAQELARVVSPAAGQFPHLDLVFLGMGSDGHTASLFPGTLALTERAKWACANFVDKLHANRVTLTYPVLNAAREVIFLVSGSEKAETLRCVLEGPHQPERLPAQGIQLANGRLSWYVDAAAAERLKSVPRSAG
jgi:6-phosphogluconolactonase